MAVLNGAAMVIVRRSYKFKEKIPKILKDKLVKDIETFNKKKEWGKWNYINKQILKIRKDVKSSDLWLVNRKEILRFVS